MWRKSSSTLFENLQSVSQCIRLCPTKVKPLFTIQSYSNKTVYFSTLLTFYFIIFAVINSTLFLVALIELFQGILKMRGRL